jgi:hypothetical protein
VCVCVCVCVTSALSLMGSQAFLEAKHTFAAHRKCPDKAHKHNAADRGNKIIKRIIRMQSLFRGGPTAVDTGTAARRAQKTNIDAHYADVNLLHTDGPFSS